MAIGFAAGPNVAPALTNAIYLPMSFLSDIFIQFHDVAGSMQQIGSWLPTYHYTPGQRSKSPGRLPFPSSRPPTS